ncbi:MAG: sigma-70 family RNA polymerase sigma factor [Clostridia bacterium]|nr:sigma-70 family RNA polymerase sigma factor [Clostridia bacterium]
MTDEEFNELFQRYKETGDIEIRNKIAEKYLYIADIIAKKFVGRGVEYGDLYQVAALALLQGIDKFDPTRETLFSTYITSRITGIIKNYFRDNLRMVKVPRRLGEISVAVRKYSAEYEKENGKKPSVKTIAQALSYSEEEVVRALEVGGTVSLDGMAGSAEEESNKSLYALLAVDEDKFDEFELRETIRAAMHDFTDIERKLIKYRFADGLSQVETAKRLGNMGQMQVSRLERKLLARLKERLTKAI